MYQLIIRTGGNSNSAKIMKGAEFKRAGQEPKFIYEGVNYKGFLSQKREDGTHLCFFDRELISEDERRTVEEKQYTSVDDVVRDGLSHILIRFEANERYSVMSIEDAKKARQKELAEKIKNEQGFIFDQTHATYEEGEDGRIPCYHYTLIHIETGKKFKFTDRNIFDFGRVINPERGGIFINVENFMNNNPYTFSNEEKRKEYIESHPTKSGWGLDKYNEPWEEVGELEIEAFLIVKKYGLADRGIRM